MAALGEDTHREHDKDAYGSNDQLARDGHAANELQYFSRQPHDRAPDAGGTPEGERV